MGTCFNISLIIAYTNLPSAADKRTSEARVSISERSVYQIILQCAFASAIINA